MPSKSAGGSRRTADLDELSLDEILDLRLCELHLEIRDTWLEACVERLYAELAERDIAFRPRCWLSDEWFSPHEAPGIAIPFFLAHPRLMQLERREIFEVEGGTKRECIKLLRHEAGHAVQIAYQVHRRRRWREMFGRSGQRYPDFYRPNPTSRRYVQHLDGWYAQSHPDEDFAETFAVWLDPRSDWRRRYALWPALRKLEYVDELMKELAGKPPVKRSRAMPHRLALLRRTLRSYYALKRERFMVDWPTAYDDDLKRLFEGSPDAGPHPRTAVGAGRFLRAHQTELRNTVAKWTGGHRFAVDQVLRDVIARCQQLRLKTSQPEEVLLREAAVMLAVHTMEVLRRREWQPL